MDEVHFLADRMREGFKPYGVRDMEASQGKGAYNVVFSHISSTGAADAVVATNGNAKGAAATVGGAIAAAASASGFAKSGFWAVWIRPGQRQPPRQPCAIPQLEAQPTLKSVYETIEQPLVPVLFQTLLAPFIWLWTWRTAL